MPWLTGNHFLVAKVSAAALLAPCLTVLALLVWDAEESTARWFGCCALASTVVVALLFGRERSLPLIALVWVTGVLVSYVGSVLFVLAYIVLSGGLE